MKCWSCGKETIQKDMFLGEGWFKCSSCRATWIDTTHLGEGKLLYMGTPWGGTYAVSKAKARELGFVY